MKNKILKLFCSIVVLFGGVVHADVIFDDVEVGIEKEESVANFGIIGIIVVSICIIAVLAIKIMSKKSNNNSKIVVNE